MTDTSSATPITPQPPPPADETAAPHSPRELVTHVGRGLGTLTPRPRVSRPLIQELRHALTARDWWVLGALAEHRVLTTVQIARLAFDTDSAARHRMHTLHGLRAVDRFRPQTPVGSAPWHYVLDKAGAILLAERHGIALSEVPYRADDAIHLAFSRQLAHTVAVNDFFTTLAAAARHLPGAELELWWPERRCARAWGSLVKPDGYGVWRHYSTQVGFFAEIDLGTEPLDALVRKVAAYSRLAHTTGINTPVLFYLPGPRREYGLHQVLNDNARQVNGGGGARVLVATAIHRSGTDLAGPIWLPVGSDGTRLPLAQLPTAASILTTPCAQEWPQP
ncbi:replication-relaxation family protein [Actinomadura sp. 6N118]|uniref:replication-relaxation family protein n=1 Tax=Actinomadura sp. 6N118 TaxID=3375151 RepID=UPI00378A5B45